MTENEIQHLIDENDYFFKYWSVEKFAKQIYACNCGNPLFTKNYCLKLAYEWFVDNYIK